MSELGPFTWSFLKQLLDVYLLHLQNPNNNADTASDWHFDMQSQPYW